MSKLNEFLITYQSLIDAISAAYEKHQEAHIDSLLLDAFGGVVILMVFLAMGYVKLIEFLQSKNWMKRGGL